MTKKQIIDSWKSFAIMLVVWFVVHNFAGCIHEATKNPPPPAQTINSIKVSNMRVLKDPIDNFFGVANLKGSVENVSSYLKTNIVITVELLDKNDVKIGTQDIKITSLAPAEEYKIDESVWNENVKSYKIRNIVAK